jgi:hypothetical protein
LISFAAIAYNEYGYEESSRMSLTGMGAEIGIELSESERQAGGRLLKLAAETDRVEGYSEPHATAVARIAVKLGVRLGLHGRDLTALKFSALAHDIGERQLKSSYLQRSSSLTDEERLDLGRHPILGESAGAEHRLPREVQLLVRWHHEWWNGSGYPDGLAGEAIPVGARILRLADTWCALNADRPHRARHDPASAEQIIAAQAGIELDPRMVGMLLDMLDEERRRREELVWGGEARAPFEANPEPVESLHEFDAAPFDSQILNQVGADFDDHIEIAPQPAANMPVTAPAPASPNRRWLGFELSVLRGIRFKSIAIPFAGRPETAWYLKFWGRQIATNDICRWSWWASRALVENRGVTLGADDIAYLLEGAEMRRCALANTGLRRFMTERDAVWFDNLWRRIQDLDSIYRQALAYWHAFAVGDYVFSFTPDTVHLRRPLSEVFTALWRSQRRVIDNGLAHAAFNRDAHDFIRGVKADLMFARLPRPAGLAAQQSTSIGWRETWVSGTDADWVRLAAGRDERLGDSVHSKEHYLELVEEFLKDARQIPKWAFAHVEDAGVSVAELSELLRRHRRRVKAYAKDFSDLLGGARAYMIVAE